MTGITEQDLVRDRVLVIDDDPHISSIITSLLEFEGFTVSSCDSGENALSAIRDKKPAVILVDFMLPGMNGLEIIHQARRIDPEIQLIAITGQGSERLAVEIMRAGAADYISKPFDNSHLVSSVKHAFRSRALRSTSLHRDLESASRELKRRAKERDAILESMEEGHYIVNRAMKVISWNRAAERMTGITSSHALGKNIIDIFGEAACATEAEIIGSGDTETFSETEITVRLNNRGEKPLAFFKSGSVLRDEDGGTIGVVVSLRDLTERKYLTNKIRELSTLTNAGKALTAKLDLQDVLNTVMTMAGDFFRAQAYSIRLLREQSDELHLAAHFGLSEEYLKRGPIPVGKSIAGAVALQSKPIHVPDAPNHTGLHMVELVRREGLKSILCYPLINRDRCIGVMTFYHKEVHYYTEEELEFLGTFAGTVAIAVDNARLYESQKMQAVTDGLTGLFNHKHFHDTLNMEISRATRYGHQIAIIILDIDYFKIYNDSYGHQAGDALLREISAILKSVARENDVVARYGGEEFVYLLHHASKAEAMLFASRLKKRVADNPFQGEDVLPGGKLTISLGVATFPEDADTAAAIIHMADKALYRAKRAGRNKVRAHQVAG